MKNRQIKAWCASNGWTMGKFAERIGVGQSWLSAIDSGKSLPSFELARAVFIHTKGAVNLMETEKQND